MKPIDYPGVFAALESVTAEDLRRIRETACKPGGRQQTAKELRELAEVFRALADEVIGDLNRFDNYGRAHRFAAIA